jgi:hypothetical protein
MPRQNQKLHNVDKTKYCHHHHLWLYSPSGPWPQLIRFRNHILQHTARLLMTTDRVFSRSLNLGGYDRLDTYLAWKDK